MQNSNEQTRPPLRLDKERLRSWLGSFCLFTGVATLAVLLVDNSAALPLAMPRSWYLDRGMWVAGALALFAAGWRLLRETPEEVREAEVESARPPSLSGTAGRGAPAFRSVVLYTRAGCHLCERAKETLEEYAAWLPAVTEIDIDFDRASFERFSTCVPVVEIDGKLRFRGRVNAVLLRRLIAAARGPNSQQPG